MGRRRLLQFLARAAWPAMGFSRAVQTMEGTTSHDIEKSHQQPLPFGTPKMVVKKVLLKFLARAALWPAMGFSRAVQTMEGTTSPAFLSVTTLTLNKQKHPLKLNALHGPEWVSVGPCKPLREQPTMTLERVINNDNF